jgi:FkbM family methyltransferase
MKDSLIFDIGCHNGQDADFYLKKGFDVVAVEANPNLCTDLKRRFAGEIAEGRFILVEKAIAEQAGDVEFFLNLKADIWGTIKPGWKERNEALGEASNKIVVPAIQFSTLVEQYGVPHYLKVDIEGADLLCVEGLLPFRERPQYISIEINDWSPLVTEMGLLRKLGYRKFQLVEQGRVPDQRPAQVALEGKSIDYHFTLGASGLFGKELQGRWLSPP